MIDKIRNEHNRGTTRVAQASKKITGTTTQVTRPRGEDERGAHSESNIIYADIHAKGERRCATHGRNTCNRDIIEEG